MNNRAQQRVGTSIAGALLVATCVVGCAGPLSLGTRTVRTPVFKEDGVRVFLRHHEEGGAPVPMGFEHPRTISSIRLARVLMGVDIRERDRQKEKGDLKAALSSDLAYRIGDGMSQALERANPEQEIVVMAVEVRKRLGVFSAHYLTSLVAWVKDDRLWMTFGEIDTQQSNDPTEKAREPTRAGGKGFRIVPSEGIRAAGATTAVASWRDPVFSKTARPRTVKGSRTLRRTILMEEDRGPDRDLPPATLSPAARRALADLEAQRRAGSLSEADYERQRREIVESAE